MQAGFRSLLAFWLGGASAPATTDAVVMKPVRFWYPTAT